MIGVVLAAIGSVLWGASDFTAGVGSRRIGAIRTTFWVFVGGFVFTAASLLISKWEWSNTALFAGIVAGVGGTVGFITFFVSLSLAPIGVATAIVAASEIVVPVVIGVAWKGDALGPIAWVGLVAATVGAVIVGGAEGGWGGAQSRAVLFAVVSGVSFGLTIIALDFAPQESGFIAPSVELLAGLIFVVLIMLGARKVPRIRAAASSAGMIGASRGSIADVILGLLAGLLLGVATIVLMFALWAGPLSVVGAITSLYPVTAAILARYILKETLLRMQVVGIAIALVGCVLLGFA